MKGYKAFNSDMTCRGFQYEVGKTYRHDGPIELCESGFHFCRSVAECYDFYPMTDNTIICEVESGDNVLSDGHKCVTDELHIIRMVEDEWMRKGNVNATSTGSRNTGDWNTGYCNTGSRNTGYCNTGSRNTGSRNTGDWNTGDWNTGDWNTGYCNTGSRNTGDCNTGSRNTGYCNTGDWNTGDWNTGDCNTGCFCTQKEPNIKLFDKTSAWTMRDWWCSRAYSILESCPRTHIDRHGDKLTIVEVTDEDRQKWWDGLPADDKREIYALPNFDPDKFCKCVGLKRCVEVVR